MPSRTELLMLLRVAGPGGGAVRGGGVGVRLPRHQHGAAVDERPHGAPPLPVCAGGRARRAVRQTLGSCPGGSACAGRDALEGGSGPLAAAARRAAAALPAPVGRARDSRELVAAVRGAPDLSSGARAER